MTNKDNRDNVSVWVDPRHMHPCPINSCLTPNYDTSVGGCGGEDGTSFERVGLSGPFGRGRGRLDLSTGERFL